MTKSKLLLSLAILILAITGMALPTLTKAQTPSSISAESTHPTPPPLHQNPADIFHDLSYKLSIHPGFPAYHFRILRDTTSGIRTILISKEPKKEVIKSISAGIGETPYDKEDYFKGVDANFDGYTDICLLDWWGVTGNKGYSFWLFDPVSSEFVFSPEFSELANPVFDQERQVITTYDKANQYIYTANTYRLEAGGKPFLIREEKQDKMGSEHHYIKTIKIRKGGVMQDSSKVIITHN